MQTARRLVKGPDTAETSEKNLATCTYVCVQVINDIYNSLTLSVARLPNE